MGDFVHTTTTLEEKIKTIYKNLMDGLIPFGVTVSYRPSGIRKSLHDGVIFYYSWTHPGTKTLYEWNYLLDDFLLMRMQRGDPNVEEELKYRVVHKISELMIKLMNGDKG